MFSLIAGIPKVSERYMGPHVHISCTPAGNGKAVRMEWSQLLPSPPQHGIIFHCFLVARELFHHLHSLQMFFR